MPLYREYQTSFVASQTWIPPWTPKFWTLHHPQGRKNMADEMLALGHEVVAVAALVLERPARQDLLKAKLAIADALREIIVSRRSRVSLKNRR